MTNDPIKMPKHQHVAPPISAALTALRERMERAQAEYASFVSHVTPPGAQLAPLPDGSWVLIAQQEEAEDANGRDG